MGSKNVALTKEQIDVLCIDVCSLQDYDHDDFENFYKLKAGLDDSDDICYTAESGESYSNNDLLKISREFIEEFKVDIDSRVLAQNVLDLCEWQHPETILDEMLREGEFA